VLGLPEMCRAVAKGGTGAPAAGGDEALGWACDSAKAVAAAFSTHEDGGGLAELLKETERRASATGYLEGDSLTIADCVAAAALAPVYAVVRSRSGQSAAAVC
jgi:glutathione S-transferase